MITRTRMMVIEEVESTMMTLNVSKMNPAAAATNK